MKLFLKTSITICLTFFIFTNGFSQGNDAIRMIFSAKTFSITENYTGDFGKYTYKYIFTKTLDNTVDIVWEEELNKAVSDSSKNVVKAKITIPIEDLKRIEKFFNNSVTKIKNTKSDRGTSLSTYTFKDELLTYEIDDNHSMICVEDMKNWREKTFSQNSKAQH